MTGIGQDLRFALRGMVRHRGASTAAIAALAIGIGFCSTLYSVADVLLFHPLKVDKPDELIALMGRATGEGRVFRSSSATDLDDWSASSRTIHQFAGYRSWDASLTGAGDPVQVSGFRVTPGFFTTMGVRPLLGRAFREDEGQPGGDQAVVLSHRLWIERFGSSPNVLGTKLELDGKGYRVAGVMPDDFRFPATVQFWTPLAMTPQERATAGNFHMQVVGRLRAGVTVSQARAEMEEIGKRIALLRPDSHQGRGVRVEPLNSVITGDLTPSYTKLCLCAGLFLLLISCANVAGIQAARLLGRTREFAVRGALGAGISRLMRQVLVESVVLAIPGLLLGLVVAVWCVDLLKYSMPAEVERFLPGWHRIGLDFSVLMWTSLTAAVAGILSGLWPAAWIARATPSLALDGSGRVSASKGRTRLRAILVTAQVALSVLLLVGAALMARSFRSISHLPSSVPPEQVLTTRVRLAPASYPTDDSVRQFFDRALEKLTALQGTDGVAMVSDIPYGDGKLLSPVVIEGKPMVGTVAPLAQIQIVSPGYRRLLGIPLLAGRDLSRSDHGSTTPVALVSRAFAERYWAGEDPVGRRLRVSQGSWVVVVGVSGDTLHDYTDRTQFPVVYLPYSQQPVRQATFLLRGAVPPATLAPAVREVFHEINPLQPVSSLITFARIVSNSTLGIAYVAWMMAVIALVALFLATLGLYSLMAFTIGQRTREIGVRLALGANHREVMWMVLKQGLFFGAGGLLVGLPAAGLLAGALEGLVFGVSAQDPITFLAVPAALLTAVCLAAIPPCLRALHTDPMEALRYE